MTLLAFALLTTLLGQEAPRPVPTPAGSPRELFEQARRLYDEGRYADAAAVYEALLAAGVVDGAVYYNLGNAYFRDGRLGRAILAYERAERLLPGDEDVRANLAFARGLLAASEEPDEPLPPFVAWLVERYEGLTPDGLAGLVTAAVLLCGLGVSALVAVGDPRAWWLVGGAGAVAALAGVLLAAKLYAGDAEREAIVLAATAEVRSGPGASHARLAEVHEGLAVRVLAARDEWVQVVLPSGLVGWIPWASVEPVDPAGLARAGLAPPEAGESPSDARP